MRQPEHRTDSAVDNTLVVCYKPLLHCERLVLRHSQADHLALSVESIEIDMGNDSKWG